jgi:hypothetical protein
MSDLLPAWLAWPLVAIGVIAGWVVILMARDALFGPRRRGPRDNYHRPRR